jgi:uncharacterized protein
MAEFETLTNDILEELKSIPTIDAHEHLPTEKERLELPCDFYSLFQHYCAADLVAAGAMPVDMALFANREIAQEVRWTRFKPFLSAIRTGSYARSALLVVRDLLGLPDLNDNTYLAVTEKLRELVQPGFYNRILQERCHIAAVIECWRYGQSPYPAYFYHLAPGPEVVDLTNKAALDLLSEKVDRSIHSLGDALTSMTALVDRWRSDPCVVGVKSGHAYRRSLGFQKVSQHEAEVLFNRILSNGEHTLSPQEALPLQDFLMFQLVARLEAVQLPIAFHTGLQAGNGNRIRNADPLLLQPLLEEFPKAKFDLFHGGMPWVREIAVLAKYFPNVSLNMAWMHIINPVQARSALAEWLDMVPNTKIFGFGGDYRFVEKVYGHLTLARQNIAMVLADKVREGAFSRAEASLVARRLMFDNPNEFYELHLPYSWS